MILNRQHSDPKDSYKPQYAYLASGVALLSVFILILIKSYAYVESGAATMLATLTDSVVDAATSLMLFFAVRLSLKPADENHRHGHGKVEGIASLLQGAFIAGAGIFLGFEAFDRFLNPESLSHHHLTISVAMIAIFLSFIVVAVQKFSLKYAPSLAIEADYAHYKTDIFLNGSVIIAMIADLKSGATWLDPLFAFMIAGYFIYTAFSIIPKSVDMLMDKELPDSVRKDIEKTVDAFPDIYGMHDLRTRMSGMNMHISFDVELSPTLTLQEAHDIVRKLDHEILQQYPNAEIIIHMDPLGDTEDPRHNS